MWKIVSTKEIFKHPRVTLLEDDIILPNGTQLKYLKYKYNADAATIICVGSDGKILVQKEYSHPIGEKIFQFPGGAVPLGEEIEKGANRELMEEADLKAEKLHLLGSYLLNNRRTPAKMYVFLATDLIEKSLPADQGEEFENHWFSEKEIERMIVNGEIINAHSLASWTIYKLKK
jgi:ADP-ribose pyrophosphatase